MIFGFVLYDYFCMNFIEVTHGRRETSSCLRRWRRDFYEVVNQKPLMFYSGLRVEYVCDVDRFAVWLSVDRQEVECHLEVVRLIRNLAEGVERGVEDQLLIRRCL